jgi:hypothetical protein
MKRSAVGLAAGLASLSIAVGGAWGATSKPYQAVANQYKTASQASKEISKLKAKHLSGYRVEMDKATKKYEVDKGYATQALATTQVSTLKKDGFTSAWVEKEKTDTKVG